MFINTNDFKVIRLCIRKAMWHKSEQGLDLLVSPGFSVGFVTVKELSLLELSSPTTSLFDNIL